MSTRIITFPSVAHAFRAEALLKQHRINVRLVAIPRSLSASCEGLAAEVDQADIETALSVLESHQVLMLYKGITVS
ncbi:MAG: DUF3343 domain-containing protein [Negativicutes bacterium]|nr:DUF3343 domain-containing protein [Negativicutes bacterium]